MTTRHRNTIILIALFFTAIGALWYADYAAIPTREQWSRMTGRLLPELIDVPTQAIQRLEIGPDGGRPDLVVERSGPGRWQMRQPHDAAADSEMIETLVRNLKEMGKSIDAGAISADSAEFGLKPPRQVVKLFVEGKPEPVTLDVGTIVQDRIYVRPGPSAEGEVVDARLLSALAKPPDEWRDALLFRVPSFRVESLTIDDQARKQAITARRDTRHWKLVAPIATLADDDKVEGIVAELTALRVADGKSGFVADDVKDLAKYGLDSPSRTFTMVPFENNGPAQTLAIGRLVPGTQEQYYARRGDQDDVVKVDLKRLLESIPGPNGLRSQTVLDFNPQRVQRVEIDASDLRFELVRGPRNWELLKPSEHLAETASVQSLLMSLSDLKASEFLEANPALRAGLDEPSFQVRLHESPREQPTSANPKSEPVVEITLGRHDALRKTVYAQIPNDPTILALPDTILESLPRNAFAFRDRAVLDVPAASFSRLTVERPGMTVTVVPPGLDPTSPGARIVAPIKAPADDAAVTGLITTLGALRANSWESETVTDSKAYGLDQPSLRVSWTLQDSAKGAKEGTLRVGRFKQGSGAFYANVEGDPRVFSLAAGRVAQLEAELHARTVAALPSEKIRRLVLKWPTRTLALAASEPGGWRAEPGYDPSGLDLSLVPGLVKAFQDLQAVRFVQYVGPISSVSGLDPAKVSIQVMTDDGSPGLTLRIGESRADGTFLATTAESGDGAVFVLPAEGAWKPFVEAPTRPGELPAEVFAPIPASR